jgi:type VI secretion system protein
MTQPIAYLRCLSLRGALLIALLGLEACSSLMTPSPELTITDVSIFAEQDANEDSAVAVDLVMIYDLDLVKSIGQMSASKYFSASGQLLLDNPTLLDVWHWELIPGQIVRNFVPPQEKGEMYAAFVFANYLTPGDHRVRVPPSGIVKILLLRDDMKSLSMQQTPDYWLGRTYSDIACVNPCDPTTVEGAQYKKKKGMTVSDLPCDEPSYHLGSTKKISSPCKKARSKGAEKVTCAEVYKDKCPYRRPRPVVVEKTVSKERCPFQMRSSFGKLLPIVAQPLPPIVSTPCSQ